MRKILLQLMLLPLLILSACSEDDKGDPTIIIAKDQQNQTAFADDTDKTIRFTATQDWRTEVDYTGTKATDAAEKWVTLDPPSGEAGEVTVKVTLSTNYTGADRRATIRIVCGGTTITVIIEQKGLDEEGNIPDDEPIVSPDRKITRMIQYEDGKKFYADLTYDADSRIKTLKSYAVEGNADEINYEWTCTYYDDRFVLEFKGYDEGYVSSGKETYTLKDGLRVSSSIDDEGDRKTFEFDAEDRMTKYVEDYANDITYTNTITWDGSLVTSVTATAGSGQPKVYKYEYYDSETVRYNGVSLDLMQLVIDEAWLSDFIPQYFCGAMVCQYIKKVTVTGDEWGKDNGTALYRYETDAKGDITKVYRTWTPEGEPAGEEYLSWEIIY